ncbi:PREDICTED: baculoviral IAP repeat-containing protein 7-B-like [Nicrophorus vespilloides]|uniref:Baculoviral IAP repeat-containing protein 7-B-like n=1 Tax=Nicrophorus vespilloides TaxID=110193 RepID=A0ABM1NCM6_NICVS|nr:PREDICTED: baculoviral IAP repeat-containing protein 7-B-like [Nicrophorus vespilloides]
MNIEENRLSTFNDWPMEAVVNSARIAKAGFYFTKHENVVECFSCHLKIGEWSYGDQVMAKHRTLSPTCPFVLDPNTSGNVPNISTNPSPVTTEDMRVEAIRLRTFDNWPATDIVSPDSLAKAGFYYLHTEDLTKCAYCNGVVGSWEAGDNPDQEHKTLFPECTFVTTILNPRLEQRLENPSAAYSNINIVAEGNLADLGVHAHKGPKKPKYGTIESRLNTFTNWPQDLIQTPDILAQAGFYYEGSGDQVRCFHCDGGLKHWDPHDEPWTEHARWFPSCGFVMMLKGQDFILACAPELDGNTRQELDTRLAAKEKRSIEQEVQNQLLLPPAIAALNIGIHVGRVKLAIREKIGRTGSGFTSRDALIESALNLQCYEEDLDGDEEMSRRVSATLNHVIENSLEQKKETRPPDEAAKEPKISLEEENRLLKEARLCKICMDCEVGIVFLPCAHLATCINCAPNLGDCPVCRSAIKATVRTFLS